LVLLQDLKPIIKRTAYALNEEQSLEMVKFSANGKMLALEITDWTSISFYAVVLISTSTCASRHIELSVYMRLLSPLFNIMVFLHVEAEKTVENRSFVEPREPTPDRDDYYSLMIFQDEVTEAKIVKRIPGCYDDLEELLTNGDLGIELRKCLWDYRGLKLNNTRTGQTVAELKLPQYTEQEREKFRQVNNYMVSAANYGAHFLGDRRKVLCVNPYETGKVFVWEI
jgi:hypothetical protein